MGSGCKMGGRGMREGNGRGRLILQHECVRRWQVVGRQQLGKNPHFKDAAGIWLEQLRYLSDMGGPRVSSILLCSSNTNYNTNTSLLLHSIYTYEINFLIIFHNGIII